jgi:serpin B
VSNRTVSFAAKLHPKFGRPAENNFYSPFSLLTALGMTAAGARGDTQVALKELLDAPANPTSANKYFGSLVAEVQGDGSEREYDLATANALWVQDGMALNPTFAETISDDYGGALNKVDYKGNPAAAIDQINRWCGEQTKGKIPTIVSGQDVNGLTRCVLTNAIYFKGRWANRFDKERTYDDTFHAPGGDVQTPMMHHDGTFNYGKTATFKALEMDYRGGSLAMLFVLPHVALADIEGDLTAVYEGAVGCLHETDDVMVTVPKFTIETEYKLEEPLIELGAGIAFSPECDLSGLTTEAKLKLTQVCHKAFVEVNEEGTEAAATTAVVAGLESMRAVPEFVADKPFLFFIRNKASGTVLFAGRLANPGDNGSN